MINSLDKHIMHEHITITNLNLQHSQSILFNQLNLSIQHGQNILITGGLGVGKTTLGKLITNNQSNSIKLTYLDNQYPKKTSFISDFYRFKNKVGLSEFYYQQRYNSQTSEDAVTFLEMIQTHSNDITLINELITLFGVEKVLHSSLVQLSSGERKKLQLIISLLKPTQVMIYDNPYIGLDTESVKRLDQYLARLISKGITFIIIGDDEYIPKFVTHIALIKDRKITLYTKTNYPKQELIIKNGLDAPVTNCSVYPDHEIIKLKNININYHDKVILHNINWTIKQGDKWLLSGHNGAGKSTLLSLICGDNPQAYANDITLFGSRRGSGESIWDIKQKIGFISPELQWNFVTSNNVLEVIISGYNDTMGLYRKPREHEINTALNWLTAVNLEQYANTQFSQLSMGVSRMILLLRALIKNPPLLIFDEPCQGLDNQSTRIFTQLVDNLFTNSNHTIIYISHRVDQIPKCIKQVLKLEHGQIVN